MAICGPPQVLGNAKGVVASVVSVMIFRNPVTAQGALGYAITIAGVYGYSQVQALLGPAHLLFVL